MPLTWKNVTGVSTDAGSEALKTAGSLFNKAFQKAEGIATTAQANLVEQNTAQALDNLRQLKTTEDFTAASEAGSLSPEALNRQFGTGNVDITKIGSAVDTRRKDLLSTDKAVVREEERLGDRALRQEDRLRRISSEDIIAKRTTDDRDKRIAAEDLSKRIDASSANIVDKERAKKQFNTQLLQQEAADNPYVTIVGDVPVFEPPTIDTPEQRDQAIGQGFNLAAKGLWTKDIGPREFYTKEFNKRDEILQAHDTFNKALTGKLKVRLTEKEQRTELSKIFSGPGFEGISSAQRLKAEDTLNTFNARIKALTPAEQASVQEDISIATINKDVALAQVEQEFNQIKRNYPTSPILNDEGEAHKISDILSLARGEKGEGTGFPASTAVPGYEGGQELFSIISNLNANGIDPVTGKVAVSAVEKSRAVPVKPWMILLAMQAHGETEEQRTILTDRAVQMSGFYKTILGHAQNTKWQENEILNEEAKTKYARALRDINVGIIKTASKIASDKRKDVGGTGPSALNTYIRTLNKYLPNERNP